MYVSLLLTLKVPEKLQLYGLCVYYVVHICDFGMLRVKYKKVKVYQGLVCSPGVIIHELIFP